MKTRHISLLVFLLLLISMSLESLGQIQSDPTAPPELISHYNRDIYSLALNRIFELNVSAVNEIVIPTEYCDTICETLACVYNAFPIVERDSVFDIHCIHNLQYYNYNCTHDIVIESDYFPHYFAWSNLTGNARFVYVSDFSIISRQLISNFESK